MRGKEKKKATTKLNLPPLVYYFNKFFTLKVKIGRMRCFNEKSNVETTKIKVSTINQNFVFSKS